MRVQRILWIVAGCCVLWCCWADEGLDMRQLDSNRDIPALFKRTYVEWAGETTCISQSMKSSEAEIKQKGPLRFSMKARTSARTGNPLMKVELWLEFYNLTRKVHKSNRYEATIRPVDSEIPSTNQTSPEPVISEEGRLVEISFNVTEIYHTSKALGKKHVHFRINIRGHPKRVAKELHGSAGLKAYLIIQEYEEICNDYTPNRQPGRFKRSLEAVDEEYTLKSKVRPSNEEVRKHHRHHQNVRPTTSTMYSILSDIADISNRNRQRKQSSRMSTNSRPGIHTVTFDSKKKRNFHRDPDPATNSVQSSLLEIAGVISDGTNLLQKKSHEALLSLKDINTESSARNHPEPTHWRQNVLHAANRKPFKKAMLKTAWMESGGHSDDPGSELFQRRSHHHHASSSRTVPLHPNSDAHTRTSCGLNEWYVSFAHIGWDSWVIAPAGVRAKTCSGVCSFPLGSHINSTAHAHLQSFVYYFKGEKWPACCVPNDFEPLTMILYDVTDQLLFMAKYPNMIATSCACL